METTQYRRAWEGRNVTIDPVTGPLSSNRLSDIITALNNAKPLLLLFGGLPLFLTGSLEARRLFALRRRLGHNELEVVARWFLKFGSDYKAGVATYMAMMASEDAHERGYALPHQLALAYLARAHYATKGARVRSNAWKLHANQCVKHAVALDSLVFAEKNRDHALKQWTRVLKDAGMVTLKLGERGIALSYFVAALALANGEAKAESQARQLRPLVARLMAGKS